MTVSSGFFNSKNHDRVYDAEQFSSLFDGVITDGVLQGYGEALEVVAYPDGDNAVIVKTGRAWFDHTWTYNDSWLMLTFDPPSTGASRFDAVVIDIDKRESFRKNSIMVVKGAYAEEPQYPELIKEDNHKQYPLAYIRFRMTESGPISQSDIFNMIGTDECPLVTGILETLDINMFVSQMQAKFETWFDGLENVLEGDVVLNLQNQINHINEELDKANVGAISYDTLEKAKKVKINTFSINPWDDWENPNRSLHAAYVLPDGYVLALTNIEDDGQLGLDIVSPQGVSVAYQAETSIIIPNAKSRNPFTVLSVNDTYPYNLWLACCTSSGPRTSASTTIRIVNITVSSNHVLGAVQTTDSFSWTAGSSYNGDGVDEGTCMALRPVRDNSNRYIFPVVSCIGDYGNHTAGGSALIGVSQDFVISLKQQFTSQFPVVGNNVTTGSLFIARNNDPSKNDYISVMGGRNSPSHSIGTYKFDPSTLKYIGHEETIYVPDFKYVPVDGSSSIVANATQIGVYDHCLVPTSYEDIPLSIEVSWSLDGAASFTGWTGGLMSPEKDLLLVGSSSQARCGVIPDSGLMIWSTPQSAQNLLQSSCISTTLLFEPHAFWASNEEGTEHTFVVPNFGSDITSVPGRVYIGTSDESIKCIHIVMED